MYQRKWILFFLMIQVVSLPVFACQLTGAHSFRHSQEVGGIDLGSDSNGFSLSESHYQNTKVFVNDREVSPKIRYRSLYFPLDVKTNIPFQVKIVQDGREIYSGMWTKEYTDKIPQYYYIIKNSLSILSFIVTGLIFYFARSRRKLYLLLLGTIPWNIFAVLFVIKQCT